MTDLVKLRPVSVDDVDNVMTWVNDPEIVGNLAAFAGKAFTREDERAYLEKLIASRDDRVFSIEHATEGRYLGQVGIHQIFWRSKVARLSIVVAAKAEMGKGYGSAAIGLTLDHAFDVLGLHKMWLMCFRTNERARAIYARVGFVEEGLLREEYFHKDAWHDMVRMSILDREWRARRASSPG